ncbi:YlxR family protein [Demequina sp. NBRC 110051]|uniref:YlxR family protein n=1 Tax=Demequina sp. NBRC 110051 TaxID=1570340 RepID=UPI000A0071C8|nr:YlxR family protein [Demequina sp. NBRC 110051]
MSADVAVPVPGSSEPVRTCIGCRDKDARSALMRLVLDGDRVIVDEAATRPGRGAWLHPHPDCLALAIRRKAFGRALRSPGADPSAVAVPDRNGTVL